jgi:hypothetical protein
MGSLVHPDTVTVLDPHHKRSAQQAAEQVEAQAQWEKMNRREGVVGGTMLFSLLASMFGYLFLLPNDIGGIAAASGLFAAAFIPVGPGLYVMHRVTAGREALDLVRYPTLPKVTVPADVAAAYSAYLEVPQQLRVAHAAEATVAAVEAHIPSMEDLLAEAGRLHALNASASEEGLALRDLMVQRAAKAQSLVVLAQRHQSAINDADASTLLVLGRAGDDTTLDTMGEQMIDETFWVRSILDGNPDLDD